ncbi:MAG: DUF2460 domain-containing protein [Xenococcaceae cyanobacterium]
MIARLEIGFDFGANNELIFKTTVIELGDGSEQRLAHYQAPLAQIQFGDRDLSTHQMHQSFQYLQQFFRERKGSQETFAVRTWDDYEAIRQPCRRLTSTTYLLEKEYGDLACPVRLPILSKLEIFVNGTKLVGGYSVDVDEGVIIFTTAKATTDVITWSGEFDRLCRFSEDKLEVRNLGYSPDMDVHILQISSLRAREVPNKYLPRIIDVETIQTRRVTFTQTFNGDILTTYNFILNAPSGVPSNNEVYLIEGGWDDCGTIGNFSCPCVYGQVCVQSNPVTSPIAINSLSVSGSVTNLTRPDCSISITLEWRWKTDENAIFTT